MSGLSPPLKKKPSVLASPPPPAVDNRPMSGDAQSSYSGMSSPLSSPKEKRGGAITESPAPAANIIASPGGAATTAASASNGNGNGAGMGIGSAIDLENDTLTADELAAQIEAQRQMLKRAKVKLEQKKAAEKEHEFSTLQQKMVDLEAAANRDLQARLQLEEALKLQQIKQKTADEHEHVLNDAIEELERRQQLEVLVAKKVELDALREKRETVDAILWRRAVVVDAIRDERAKRQQNDSSKLDALLQRADVLAAELARGDTYSVEDRARYAGVWLTDPADASGEAAAKRSDAARAADREVLEEILSRRHQRYETERLTAEETIRKLNEQRRALNARFHQLSHAKEIHEQVVMARGPDFAVEVELGRAPPLELLWKNREQPRLANAAAGIAPTPRVGRQSTIAAIAGRKTISFAADEKYDSKSPPADAPDAEGASRQPAAAAADGDDDDAVLRAGFAVDDDADATEVIASIQTQLPRQTAAVERLRTEFAIELGKAAALSAAAAATAATSPASASPAVNASPTVAPIDRKVSNPTASPVTTSTAPPDTAPPLVASPLVAEAYIAVAAAAAPVTTPVFGAGIPIAPKSTAAVAADAAAAAPAVPPLTGVPYGGQWALARYPADKRTAATMIRAFVVDELVPSILSHPLFVPFQPKVSLSNEELTNRGILLAEEQRRHALVVSHKAQGNEALSISSVLLQDVCEEMTVHVLTELYRSHRIASELARDVLIDAVWDSAAPVDRAALGGAYEEMQRRRERWLAARIESQRTTHVPNVLSSTGTGGPAAGLNASAQPFWLQTQTAAAMSAANANRTRFTHHSAVLMLESEVSSSGRATAVSAAAAAAGLDSHRAPFPPLDSDDASEVGSVSLPIPKPYGLTLPPPTLGPGQPQPPTMRQASTVAERLYFRRTAAFRSDEVRYWENVRYVPVSLAVPPSLLGTGSNAAVFTTVRGSPDARFIAAGTDRGGIFIWKMPPADNMDWEAKPVLIRAIADGESGASVSGSAAGATGAGGAKLTAVVELRWSSNSTQLLSVNGRGVIAIWEFGHASTTAPVNINAQASAAKTVAIQRQQQSNKHKHANSQPNARGVTFDEETDDDTDEQRSAAGGMFPVITPYSPLTAIFRLSMPLTYPHASIVPDADAKDDATLSLVTPPHRAARIFAGDLYRPAVAEPPSVDSLRLLQPSIYAGHNAGSTTAAVCWHPAFTLTGHQPSLMVGLTGGLIVKWNVSDAGAQNSAVIYGGLPIAREPPLPASVLAALLADRSTEQARRKLEWEKEVNAWKERQDRKNGIIPAATPAPDTKTKPGSKPITEKLSDLLSRDKTKTADRKAGADTKKTAATSAGGDGIDDENSIYDALHPERWISSEEQREDMRMKHAFVKANSDYIKREFFQSHTAPLLLVDFIGGSTTMISVDTTAQIRVWPYSGECFTGFGWFRPERVYRLDRSMLVIVPIDGDTTAGANSDSASRADEKGRAGGGGGGNRPPPEPEILFAAPDDGELKRASKSYTDSATFRAIKSQLQPKPYDSEHHISLGTSAMSIAAATAAGVPVGALSGYSYSHTYLPLFVPTIETTAAATRTGLAAVCAAAQGRNRLHTFTYSSAGLLKRHAVEPYQLVRVTGDLVSVSLTTRRRELVVMIRYKHVYNCGLEFGFTDSAVSTERALEEQESTQAEADTHSAPDQKGGDSNDDDPFSIQVALRHDTFRRRRLRARRILRENGGRGADFVRCRVIKLVPTPDSVSTALTVTPRAATSSLPAAVNGGVLPASYSLVASDIVMDFELTSPKQRPSFVVAPALDCPPSDYVYIRAGDPDAKQDVIAVYSMTTGQCVTLLEAQFLGHRPGATAAAPTPAAAKKKPAAASAAIDEPPAISPLPELPLAGGVPPAIQSWDVSRDHRWLLATSSTAGHIIYAYRIVDSNSDESRQNWNHSVLQPDIVPRWASYSVEERVRSHPDRNMACGTIRTVLHPAPAPKAPAHGPAHARHRSAADAKTADRKHAAGSAGGDDKGERKSDVLSAVVVDRPNEFANVRRYATEIVHRIVRGAMHYDHAAAAAAAAAAANGDANLPTDDISFEAGDDSDPTSPASAAAGAGPGARPTDTDHMYD